jgi:ribosomal protein L24
MAKNGVSFICVNEARWKGQGEIRSGDYTMYYSGGEKSERGVVIVVHKSKVGSVVKKIVCNDRLTAVKLNAEPVNVLIVQVYMPNIANIVTCQTLGEMSTPNRARYIAL